MASDDSSQISQVLAAVAQGDARAAERLLPLVYDELRKLARWQMMKAPPGQTLQPTALVHEAFVRLVKSGDPGWDGRNHFFGAAAQAMRNILVDQARRKAAVKHGGERRRVDMDDVQLAIALPCDDVLALNEVLTQLEAQDPRKGQIVNLRYFAGLSVQETAAALGVSIGTIEREWRYIKAWLFTRLSEQAGAGSESNDDPR